MIRAIGQANSKTETNLPVADKSGGTMRFLCWYYTKCGRFGEDGNGNSSGQGRLKLMQRPPDNN